MDSCNGLFLKLLSQIDWGCNQMYDLLAFFMNTGEHSSSLVLILFNFIYIALDHNNSCNEVYIVK